MLLIILIALSCIVARDADLIEIEIAQLEHLIQLHTEKLHYLKELREISIANQQNIPSIDQQVLQEIVQKKPYKTQSGEKQNLNKERSFTNRMLKKYQFNITNSILDASLIQTFQYKSPTTDNSFTQMLYVVTNTQEIEIYDLSNTMIVNTQLDFQPQYVSISNRADDPILALASTHQAYIILDKDGQFALYKLENSRVPIETQDSQKAKTKVVIQLNKEFELNIENQQITSMIYAIVKGTKYILFGSSNGSVYVYNRNGTLIGERNFNTPILQVVKSYPNMLYLTSTGFGYINPTNLEIVQPICDNLPFQIVHLTLDIQQTNIVYALSDLGEVYVFEIKQNEQCKMKLKLVNNQQPQFPLSNPKLLSLRHYLIVYDQENRESLLYNTTDILTEVDYDQPFNLEFFKQIKGQQVVLQSIKGNGASHYLLTREVQNDHELISYYEITMPQKKDTDIFSNFRFPIIIIAIVIVLLYQFWFKGKKQEKKEKGSKKKLRSEDEEIEQILNQQKKPFSGPGGSVSTINNRSPTRSEIQNGQKQVRFDENLKRADKFKEQLDNLDQKTKLLNERVGVTNNIEAQRQKLAQQALLQKNKYV
ncbi:unnamed protein product (macronuclear) [Paramecium tetraurelia]|uniref:Transmembrane protein n=1 Tax=Paramecium tetraurelia TaxID=5888 RepID=A0BGC1_PARTE|nr:uncharacterized protein GSPATT00028623001 [Paramecium tetraurelia]CAK57588.1 unnamed protein product [Paramecium tetraurelia]|eukprot:XP_001424986.1 hypothetical protein (macronuclear) [Paramecium tetraurelia strain d4-2]